MTKIRQPDFVALADYISEELTTRKKNRDSLDYQIKEIDRQISMTPDLSHKLDANGNRDEALAWLPEIELPLQAEALETLTADSRSMLFPDAGPWFTAHSALTDSYLQEANVTSIITGDENDLPTQVTQDNVDQLVAGFINHQHRQYDFRGFMDQINAEAYSYGTGVARARMVEKAIYRETSRGVISGKQKIPVLIPRSIKETYLDDRTHITMHEGYSVGPMTIFTRTMPLEDLKRKAKGNTNPEMEDGGWMPGNVKEMQGDKNGNIELIEAEGDFVIPRKTTGDIYSPGTIVTIAAGKNNRKVVRIQFRKYDFDSVLVFPYHQEQVGCAYSTSPLRKGRPLQAAAVEALMRLVEVSALNAQPPVGYDRSDMWFAQQGGPRIHPRALWGTIGDIEVHQFGDVQALFAVYQGFLSQYADAVGVHRARLGAQTLSHTTAFAKSAELQRGAVRTVDYVRSTLQGPLTKWLHMAYEMGRKNFKGIHTFYVDAYRGFVSIPKHMLPEKVVFEAHGSGGPAEENEKRQMKLQAVQMAMQIDAMNVQMGKPAKLNLAAIIEEVLSEGGWIDTDPFLATEAPPQRGPGGFTQAALMQEAGVPDVE